MPHALCMSLLSSLWPSLSHVQEQSVKVADLYMQQWDQQLGTRIASWKARLLPLLEIQVNNRTCPWLTIRRAV